MKSYILLLGLLLGGFTAYADSTAKKETEAILIGHVVDSRSGEHLPFITITVKGTTIGTTTDVSGHYLLGNLPVGRPLTVVAQSVGYKSAERSVTLGAHSTTELNFELEEQAVDVGEVVVEIDRNSVIRKETPSLVNILNSKLFERTNAATLADGLSFQPGVRVEDGCQNCGFAQVRINGLDGHYSQILLDSRPLFSALNGVYGLEQIPANMIERVEVIRGGGSALFGASAIGGTINIITKEPLRDWAEIGHTLMSVGCSGAYDNNTTINASLVSNNRKAGIYVYGQNRYRSGYDHDGDGYTELPNLRNQMFGMRSYLRTGDHSKLTLEYHGINEFRRGGNRLDLPAHEANITEQTDHNINGASVAFDLFSRDDRTRHLSVYSAVQQTTRKSYYGGTGEGATDEELENARKAYGRTDGLTVISGAQFLQRFERLLFLPSELTLGVEHSYDHIDDVTIGYDMRTNQKVHILSGVIQNEWKARKWSFLLGGRFDHHNMVDHVIFSPRINLRYNPTAQINLRLNYAGGFRAPQTFDEDLHIALVGGERVVTQLAPDLREERSNSLSASIDLYRSFGSVETNLLVEGFYTALDHIFATRYLPEPNEKGETVLERYNGGGATVAGVNVEAKAAFSRWFDLQAGITWPLRTRPALERRRARRTPHVPFARLVRLPDGQLRPRAAVRHLAVGHLHRRDARPARRRFGHAGRRGGHHARFLRAERQTGLRIHDPPNAHPATQRRRAESLRLLPVGFRPGLGARFRLRLRAVAATQLVRRGENPLLRTVAATHEKRETCVRHVSLIVRRRRTRLTPTPRNGARRLFAQPAGRPRRSRPSLEYVPSDWDGTYCLRYRCADRAPRAPGTTCRPPYNDRSRNRDGSRRA